MSKFVTLHGFGGGSGSELNFEVVGGTTQPENPKENTIWINTDTEITEWIFSATEPENLVEGMVWIRTGVIRSGEFNVLKKNSIQLYPDSAQHYINGSFVKVETMIYQNSEWTLLWNGVLLKPNNTCDEYTGGWIADASIGIWSAGTNTPTVTHNNNIVKVTLTGNNIRGCYRTVDKVNFDDYKFLKVHFNNLIYSDRGAIAVAITSKLNASADGNAAAIWINENIVYQEVSLYDKTITLDISNVSGEFYVAIIVRTYDNTNTISANITKVYLE